MKKNVCALLLVLLTLSLTLGGCSFLDDLRLFRSGAAEGDSDLQPPINVSEQGLDVDDAENGGVAEGTINGSQDAEAADPTLSAEVKEVLLYFADADGQKLAAESRTIPRQIGMARATVSELIAGPQSSALSPTLPAGAIVEGMNIADGICTVDFSGEFQEQMPADAQSQLLAVYSLVNTLTQFDTVDKVRILVDGEPISGGLGGVDLSAALAPVTL